MVKLLKKLSIFFLLTVCFLFMTACSINILENNANNNENMTVNMEENMDENTSSEDTANENEIMTSNMEEDEEENKASNIESSSADEEIVTEFVKSQTSIKSIIYRSSTDVGSEFSKEVKETLSEFNAMESDDGTKLILPDDILFDFDSDELRSDADEVIDQLVEVIETADGDVMIFGHTDSRGEDDYNQRLSESRADAVRQALVDKNVDDSRISAEGKGATEPVASNTNSDGSDNPDGRQKNRRVEMVVEGLGE